MQTSHWVGAMTQVQPRCATSNYANKGRRYDACNATPIGMSFCQAIPKQTLLAHSYTCSKFLVPLTLLSFSHPFSQPQRIHINLPSLLPTTIPIIHHHLIPTNSSPYIRPSHSITSVPRLPCTCPNPPLLSLLTITETKCSCSTENTGRKWKILYTNRNACVDMI
jgi:hypothetical protein